jgi:hypothetical protein
MYIRLGLLHHEQTVRIKENYRYMNTRLLHAALLPTSTGANLRISTILSPGEAVESIQSFSAPLKRVSDIDKSRAEPPISETAQYRHLLRYLPNSAVSTDRGELGPTGPLNRGQFTHMS